MTTGAFSARERQRSSDARSRSSARSRSVMSMTQAIVCGSSPVARAEAEKSTLTRLPSLRRIAIGRGAKRPFSRNSRTIVSRWSGAVQRCSSWLVRPMTSSRVKPRMRRNSSFMSTIRPSRTRETEMPTGLEFRIW